MKTSKSIGKIMILITIEKKNDTFPMQIIQDTQSIAQCHGYNYTIFVQLFCGTLVNLLFFLLLLPSIDESVECLTINSSMRQWVFSVSTVWDMRKDLVHKAISACDLLEYLSQFHNERLIHTCYILRMSVCVYLYRHRQQWIFT